MSFRPLVSFFLMLSLLASACQSSKGTTIQTVKPKYHHSWYKKHVYKKKWHVGRIHFRPEKQGVKQVKMKN
jgi:hypothetical protein